MFTRTVTIGETGVNFTMTKITQPDNSANLVNWRKDGGDKIDEHEGSLTFTFPNPIEPSDEGIYEIYYDNERSSGRGALYRIIVRGTALPLICI